MAQRSRFKKPKRTEKPKTRAAERVQAAIALHQRGQIEEAARCYRAILKDFPAQADAWHFLGVTEYQQNRPDKALEFISRALELEPDSADIYNNRGNIFKLQGKLDEAEKDYRAALLYRANDVNALNNLGTVMRSRGHLEQALEQFQKVIVLRPDHVEAYQNIGNVYGLMNRFEEALEAHRHALRLYPAAGESYRQLGAILYALGRIDEATEMYSRWLEVEPESPEARHLVAGCTERDVPDRASDAYVRTAFNRYAESFDASLARLEYRAPALVNEAVKAVYGEPGGLLAVLDAGCGTGLCGADLRPYARRLLGVDLSAEMMRRAAQRGFYHELIESELTAFLAAQTRAYDLIVAADTLVYFGPLERAAGAVAGALKPGGYFIYTVERLDCEEARSEYRIHPHGRYSHAEPYLRKVSAAAGLVITELRKVDLRKEAGKRVEGWLVTSRLNEI